MTREDVIRMAREAGWNVPHAGESGCESCGIDLERFAALVAAAEREACAKEGWMAASWDCEDRVANAIRARGRS